MIHKKLLTAALLSLIVSSSAQAFDGVLTIVNENDHKIHFEGSDSSRLAIGTEVNANSSTYQYFSKDDYPIEFHMVDAIANEGVLSVQCPNTVLDEGNNHVTYVIKGNICYPS